MYLESRNSVRAKSCPIPGFTSDTLEYSRSTSADIWKAQNPLAVEAVLCSDFNYARLLEVQRKWLQFD